MNGNNILVSIQIKVTHDQSIASGKAYSADIRAIYQVFFPGNMKPV